MGEAEPPGVQGLARESGDPGAEFARSGDSTAGARAINRVADQRVAEMRQMHADLVGAAGREAAFDQRRLAVERALDPVAGHRRLAPLDSPTTAIFLRLAGLRPMLPAISPAGGCGTPQTKAA